MFDLFRAVPSRVANHVVRGSLEPCGGLVELELVEEKRGNVDAALGKNWALVRV
jgi:hypothetical protein